MVFAIGAAIGVEIDGLQVIEVEETVLGEAYQGYFGYCWNRNSECFIL
jgi:hypothetical protein